MSKIVSSFDGLYTLILSIFRFTDSLPTFLIIIHNSLQSMARNKADKL